MLTAILPIRLKDNPFWSSDRGLTHTHSFLSRLATNPDIDRVFILSTEDHVYQLSKQYNMAVLRIDNIEAVDDPYSFEQTIALARTFHRVRPSFAEDLIIIDHRNLYLSSKELKDAISTYQYHRHSGVISVALCQDHPCQLRSYYIFAGCRIFHFQGSTHCVAGEEGSMAGLRQTFHSPCNGWEDVTISIHLQNSNVCISVDSQNSLPCGLIAHVLPFTPNGPLYNSFREMTIVCTRAKTLHGLDPDQLAGIVVTLFIVDPSGAYDTIECFTSQNADWELSAFCDTVVDKKSQNPIQGRQQFSPVYAYDGSFCIINVDSIYSKKKMNPIPVMVDRSCIVTDWVEYYRYASGQSKPQQIQAYI